MKFQGNSNSSDSLDIYRRASLLEQYSEAKVRELNETEKKKKKKLPSLICCENAMVRGISFSYILINEFFFLFLTTNF